MFGTLHLLYMRIGILCLGKLNYKSVLDFSVKYLNVTAKVVKEYICDACPQGAHPQQTSDDYLQKLAGHECEIRISNKNHRYMHALSNQQCWPKDVFYKKLPFKRLIFMSVLS